MRSAELSGIGGRGFASALRRVSPFSWAVAVAAVLSATTFVVADIIRTLDIVGERRELMHRLEGAQPILGRQFVATAFEPMLVETDEGTAWSRLWQRGALAYGLAFVVMGVAYRRRNQPSANEMAVKSLISTIPFGVACWTAEGRLITCNEQYRARLNASPADVRPGASYSASVRRFVQGGYLQLVSEGEDNRVLELHREDGSCLMVDERPLAEGGFVTLVTDVTETRRTDHLLSSIREEQRVLARRYHEEKLRAEAASQSKTAFLAHLSHDIRTPLNHIIGFAELMRHETYGPLGNDRYADYIESIRTSGERLLRFFAATLDLAELEGGRRVLNPTEIDVDDLLGSVVNRFTAQAQRKGIALMMGAQCNGKIVADRFSLERMLGNLIDNAIRYTPARGRVTLQSYAGSDGVVLEVTDTGQGMSAERLQSVSQPLSFGDASLARERDGMGLGLAIARTIVELSGGHLAIDSRPGLGTTVAVSLPTLAASSTVDVAAE